MSDLKLRKILYHVFLVLRVVGIIFVILGVIGIFGFAGTSDIEQYGAVEIHPVSYFIIRELVSIIFSIGGAVLTYISSLEVKMQKKEIRRIYRNKNNRK